MTQQFFAGVVAGSAGQARRRSAGVTAQVGAVSAAQDWINRSTGAGVTKVVRFNSTANVTNFTHADSMAANVAWSPGGVQGDGCLKINSKASDAANSGAWRWPIGNWANDTDGPGIGADVYVQFRFMFGQNRFAQANPVSGQTVQGFKLCNLAGYRTTSPNSSQSHTSDEIVVAQKGEQSRAPWPYRDTASAGLPESQSAEGFSVDSGGVLYLQNAIDNGAGLATADRFCIYDVSQTDAMSAGCWRWKEGVWYTVLLHWKNATPNGKTGNRFRMWVADEFSSNYTLLEDHTDCLFGSDPTENPNGIRGLWFAVYTTNRASGNADTYHLYDEVISSTQFIQCPAARVLPSFVSSTLADWAQIPSSNISAMPSSSNIGNYGPAAKVDAWCGWAVDRRTSRVVEAGAGGHSDYPGNEVASLDLEGAATWVERRGPTAAGSIQDARYYGDGRPTSVHTYYGEMFDEWSNRVLRLCGARWNVGAFTPQFDAFDMGTNDWVAAATYPDVPGAVHNNGGWSAVAFAQDPRTGDIYAAGNFVLYKWTRATNTWADVTPASMPALQRACTAWDTKRNRFLVVGGDLTPGRHTYAPDTGTLIAQTFTGVAAASVSVTDAGLTYVPSLDAFLLSKAEASGVIYKIDASTFVCTVYATTGGSGMPAGVHGPFTRFQHVPRLKGCFWFPAYAANGWFLRTDP